MTVLCCACRCHHGGRTPLLLKAVPINDRVHAATACRGCAEDHVVPFRRGGDDPIPRDEMRPEGSEDGPRCDRCGTAMQYYHSPGGYYLGCPVCSVESPGPPPPAGAGEGPE